MLFEPVRVDVVAALKMAESDDDSKALVPVQQGNEVALQNGVVDPNNLPILKAQENQGIFERTSDDGKTRERMHQKQQMQLRGMDTQNQSIRVMEGRDQKIVEQENEEGTRTEFQEQSNKRIMEKTPTSQTKQDLLHKKPWQQWK